MFNFWWLAKWSEQKTLTKMQKKKPPKSLKNEMFIFGLRSTSDDQPSNPSKKHQPKCKKQKRPPKSSKIKMFIFGLCSTSDDRLSDPSKKCQTKHKTNKKGPLSYWKIKCLFLDYIQLLMIGRVIWVTNDDWNAKKGPLSHQKWNVHFLMVYPKTTRRPAEDCQKTMRDCQKTSRRPPEGLWLSLAIF